MSGCYRYWARHCCYADGKMLYSPWGVIVEFAAAFALMMTLMVSSPLDVPAKTQAAAFMAGFVFWCVSCLSCMDDWGPQVAAMTNRRRRVYWVLCAPFFFMAFVMTLFRCFS